MVQLRQYDESQLQIVSWDTYIKRTAMYMQCYVRLYILSKWQYIHTKWWSDKAMKQMRQAHIYSTLPLKQRCEFVQMYMYILITWCICSVHCCHHIVDLLLIISLLHHCQSQPPYKFSKLGLGQCLGKNVCNVLQCWYVLHFKLFIFHCLTNKMILQIDMLGSWVVLVVFC